MSWKNLETFCKYIRVAQRMYIDPENPPPNMYQEVVKNLEASGVVLTDYDKALFACIEEGDLDLKALELIVHRMKFPDRDENGLLLPMLGFPAEHPPSANSTTPDNKSKIVSKNDDAERENRRRASRQADANNAIDGWLRTPAEEALFERWENGELDDEQLIKEIHTMNGTTPED